MFGAIHRRRRRGRRGGRATLGTALALLLAAWPADAPAERRRDDAPARAWRSLKRVPGQLGAATGRALREFEAGIEQGRRSGARRPPELAPDAEEDPPYPPEAGEDAAFGGLFDSEPAAESEGEPEPSPSERAEASDAAPAAPDPPARAAGGAGDGTGLRAALLGAFATAALAAGALALRRRRRPLAPDVETPTPPAPARDLPPVLATSAGSAAGRDDASTVREARTTVAFPPSSERTTLPRQPVGPDLDARSESALADALARDLDDRPTPFPGGGRYELLAEIGRGGMGVVYRARDKRLDRIVALKRLPENLQSHPRAVQLLLREARSAAQLNHPNIVTVYDVDHEDGGYFLTMELLEGHPLATLLRRRGRFTPAEVLWLGRQAAAGLAYAHERRIVHRDVKTANLFLTRSRVLKIMDFGLAKMIEAVRRRSTRIGGTPDYMAPEQTLGLEVDGRADLYALGATLHELLTGAVLFEEGDAMRHQRQTPPPDPRERAPEVPAALAELVLQMLAKQPEGRPSSAAEVVARLRAIEGAAARGGPG